jgi:hypothetical protein
LDSLIKDLKEAASGRSFLFLCNLHGNPPAINDMDMARPKNLTENYRLRPRKDGIFEVAWSDLVTGKPRRVSTGTKDQQIARVKFAQIVADSQR